MQGFNKAIDKLKQDMGFEVKGKDLRSAIEAGAKHISETMGKRPKTSSLEHQRLSSKNPQKTR